MILKISWKAHKDSFKDKLSSKVNLFEGCDLSYKKRNKFLTIPDQVRIIKVLALLRIECQKLKIVGGLPNVKTIRRSYCFTC